ncbi:hypothetical protein DDZ14_06475 [Maritimibacter sp. 55A14]|uniref:TfoX/Sxy family protein n=1 Tax=Maritimibacter sp. 55A14 TaxID=2174844 RepID=UPI000D620EC2|nr:TfoX/Sxy family protein [Maritimibacter sp. 55A14]PWE33062.1 hypothetical protein DDZ14_06475 [Maritimibacter sp. 55A14]
MAYDEGAAETMREDLADLDGLTERRMFGGLCFLWHGHMLCGIHARGAMYRVGKASEPAALAIPGARPMDFTGRKMGGIIETDLEVLADDAARATWLGLAKNFVTTLPPK